MHVLVSAHANGGVGANCTCHNISVTDILL